MRDHLPLVGVVLLAAGRTATAAAAFLRFGPSSFAAFYLLEGLALAALAVAFARTPWRDAAPRAAAVFVVVALAQACTVAVGVLGGGASLFTVGDLLFVAGFLGASGAALAAAKATGPDLGARAVRAHLAVAASAPALWLVLNVTRGFLDFAFTSLLAFAGLALLTTRLAPWNVRRPAGAAEASSPALQ